jgi:hypothetical protein
MFIERRHHPTIELNVEAGQEVPSIVHYLSDRAEPLKTVLPQLIEGAGQDAERVFVIESPLNEIMDWTIELHRHAEFVGQAVVDEKHRAFFQAVKASLTQAIAQIDKIQFVAVDDDDEEDA